MWRARAGPQSVMGGLRAAMAAQAAWELANSRFILRHRKGVLALALLPVLLGVAAGVAWADEIPARVPILGGSRAYLPAFVTPRMFGGSIFVGLIAGLITGVIGAGGGYILTPALMSFGVKGIMAVGTDQFHLFAKAIMGTAIHRKLGNVNVQLAAWFALGSAGGVTLGGVLNRRVYQASPALSDALISTMYVVVLGALGFYAALDWLRLRRRPPSEAARTQATTRFATWLQSVPMHPRVRFDQDLVPAARGNPFAGRVIGVYPVIGCGFVVGCVASIMGVGGGFLTFPMFVYGLGVSTFTTVGTDILQIVFTTFYSSVFQYAIYGFVFYSVAMGMLVGSLVGVQIGALVTTFVAGSTIRAFYALTILAGFANRACALVRKLSDAGYLPLTRQQAAGVEAAGTVVFFGLVGLFAVWILATFVTHVGDMRRLAAAEARPGEGALPLVPPAVTRAA